MKNRIFIMIILFTSLMAGCTSDKEVLAPVVTDQSMFNFESGLADGWTASGYADSLGVTGVSSSAEQAAAGDYSLKLAVTLVAQSATLSKGEAYVDMRKFKPYNVNRVPVALNNKTVTFWAYIPGDLKGEVPSAPNGLQVLLKDSNFKNWYSSFLPMVSTIATNTWYKVEMAVSTAAGSYGFMDDGFDPDKVIIFGVKIGTSGTATNVNVNSSFYIDAVTWK
ncbi:MAG: hypothetical protein PHF84_06510 [bacterium]|nr:hypothetical protein [bacterium]